MEKLFEVLPDVGEKNGEEFRISRLAEYDVVGVYLVEDGVERVKEAGTKILELLEALEGKDKEERKEEAGDEDVGSAIVVEVGSEERYCGNSTVLVRGGADVKWAVALALGLGPAISCPTFVLLSGRSGRVLATDAMGAVRRGTLDFGRIESCRVDCFRVVEGSVDSGDRSWMHPSSVLQANLYPGDPVTVRVLHSLGERRTCATVYVNRTADSTAEEEVDERRIDDLEKDVLVVPKTVLETLAIREGDDLAISITEPRPADVIHIKRTDSEHSSEDESLISTYFGLQGDQVADALSAALLEELGTSGGDAMRAFVRQRACPQRGISTDLLLRLPIPETETTATFQITHVVPRTATVVGPDTIIEFV